MRRQRPSTPSPAAEPAAVPTPKRRSPKSVLALTALVGLVVVVGLLAALSRPENVPEAGEGVQRIRIETAGGEFQPNEVRARAGEPIELEFPPGGSGCTASIAFPALDVSKDLTRGGLVALPALDAGVYVWKGACGSESGSLRVE